MPFAALAFVAALSSVRLSAAAAECEPILETIRGEIAHAYRMEVSCERLQAAAQSLPIDALSPVQGLWVYAGEQELRDALWRDYRIRFSTALLPLGIVKREAPEGPGQLVVFGLEMPRRSWGLLSLAQQDERVPTERAAQVLAEGAVYDWVGIYRLDAGRRRQDRSQQRPPEGRWLRLEAGGTWSSERPAPIGETRACVGCRGWLCPPEPIVCFADLNLNGSEEALLIDDCKPHACGLRIIESDVRGQPEILLNTPGVYGEWTRHSDGWVLVSEVYCPWGEFCGEGSQSLGKPDCERPDVYRFDRKTGRPVADPDLREQYYPVEDRRAPLGCVVDDPKGALVYAPEGRFVRYFP